eukprot:NODE_5132_length_979_cov_46.031542_g4923_i0.p1 GENE.NODE_5132_length_979_cov_46.031542_g4923_i0~~NODE_5132_length_979_cov_46.031542_g4923_i0.p1  ORF type:complete len:177 (+),score=34.31 NODE_5132_length_979_cov_46.031542_g4923_i0:263-793(+)
MCLQAMSTVDKARTYRRPPPPDLPPSAAIPFHTPNRRGLWRCPVCLNENESTDQCSECSSVNVLLPPVLTPFATAARPSSTDSRASSCLTSRSLTSRGSISAAVMPGPSGDLDDHVDYSVLSPTENGGINGVDLTDEEYADEYEEEELSESDADSRDSDFDEEAYQQLLRITGGPP